jgi:Zn-dependent protease with chaperone function
MTETNGTREHEHIRQPMELNQMLGRNRLRLAFMLSTFILLAMGISGLGTYLIYRLFDLSWSFWLILVLFWCAYIIYVILRFILSWRWMFRRFATEPAGPADGRLQVALDEACIAAGLVGQVKLMVMPNDDVNSFSLALPDGSYVVIVTRGAADKLPDRAREAMLAHEIGHIQAGDTLLQTIYLCLVGRSGFSRKLLKGSPYLAKGRGDVRTLLSLTLFAALFFGLLFLYYMIDSGLISLSIDSVSPAWLIPVLLAFLFLLLAMFLPLAMHPLFRLALDREREYAADLQAVYRTRDPLAVYQAVEGAAFDVENVMLLPRYLDILLFCPVVDFTSYHPFRTQPTMQERLQHLRESFPALDCELQGRSQGPTA